jgi:hypothetical protein
MAAFQACRHAPDRVHCLRTDSDTSNDAGFHAGQLVGSIIDKGQGLNDISLLPQRLELDDLLPLLNAVVMLGFAEVTDGDVCLTPIGIDFATTMIQRRKDLFRLQRWLGSRS